jgi:hypothetical protein
LDGRNRTLISLPAGLRVMTERYQNDRNIVSLSAAVVELLETHPEIQRIYAETLDRAVTLP